MRELAARDIITNMGVDILYYVDHDLPTDCAQSFLAEFNKRVGGTANGELLAVGLTVRWKSNFQIRAETYIFIRLAAIQRLSWNLKKTHC